MLELINRARADPAAEGVRLISTGDSAVQSAYREWNVDTAQIRSMFATYSPRAPLAFSEVLNSVAREHTLDMINNNFEGSNSSLGYSLRDRFRMYQYKDPGAIGENVSAFGHSVWFSHCLLNVDWRDTNQRDLPNRSNIMNLFDPTFTEVGIFVRKTNSDSNQGTVGPFVVTQDYGSRPATSVSGVVYHDKNANAQFDLGEGLGRMEVYAGKGDMYAITTESGGFTIPYSFIGIDTLSAYGGVFSGQSQAFTASGSNVKVDFAMKPTSGPGRVLIIGGLYWINALLQPRVRWHATENTTHYFIEVATSPTFEPWSIVDTATSIDTVWTMKKKLRCITNYWYRVQARNATHVGEWCAVHSLYTEASPNDPPYDLLPNGPVTIRPGDPITFTCRHSAPEYKEVRATFKISQHRDMHWVMNTSWPRDTTWTWIPPWNGPYYWTVSIKDSCGNTYPSDTTEILVYFTTDEEDDTNDPVVDVQYFDLLGRNVPDWAIPPLLRVSRTRSGRTRTERVWIQTSVK